jgi:hypothetical protein
MLQLARKALRELIEQMERASSFFERRLKHAFALYGTTLVAGNEAEETALEKLLQELTAFNAL